MAVWVVVTLGRQVYAADYCAWPKSINYQKTIDDLFGEINFDGFLIGPTHNYAGLSQGSASQKHLSQTSNPQAAPFPGAR